MQTKNTQTTTIYCSSCGKRVSGAYYTSTMSDLIVCHSCRQVRPYGGNTPSIKHRVGEADVTADVTTTTGKRQPRQSREAQRNARIHQAFLTLRGSGGRRAGQSPLLQRRVHQRPTNALHADMGYGQRPGALRLQTRHAQRTW